MRKRAPAISVKAAGYIVALVTVAESLISGLMNMQ